MRQLTEYLEALEPAGLSYNQWLSVGMALKEEGYPVSVWDDWSARDQARYHSGECARKWESFKRDAGEIVTGGTVYQICKEMGCLPRISAAEDFSEDEWHPGEDLRRYIETLFRPSDIVNVVTKSYFDEKSGKYVPCNQGNNFKASDILERLETYGDDIGAAVGDYTPAAGAWIRFNPMDGKGVKNENVAAYRYALIESDTLSIAEQLQKYEALNLPIAALIHSGGKSAHAIVRIDAPDEETYRKRVYELFRICKENGLQIDEQNKNASRLSRLPGCIRGENYQYLISTNVGAYSWEQWKKTESKEEKKDIPKLKPISAAELNALELPDINWIVQDLLPEGVAILSAPPKSYKSYMMLNLCIEVCRGGSFMEHVCNKSHALYLDLESGKRRPRDRMKQILNGEPPPDGLYYLTGEDDVQRVGEGFEDQITDLLKQDRELRLIVVDVLKMIRPAAKRGQLAYDADYELITPLGKIAHAFPGVCIVAVTHDKKMRDPADWTNNLSGSTGLTGAVDVIMRIDRDERDSKESTLQITGRDVEPQALQMTFNKDSMKWEYLGTRESIENRRFAEDYSNSPVVKAIKKGVELENGRYCATISELITASFFWGCPIHDTARKVSGLISKYETMLAFDGIEIDRDRPGGRRREYIFSLSSS